MRPFTRLISLFVAIGALVLTGCDSSDPDEPDIQPDPTFDRAEMLANIGNNIIIPSYQSFQSTVNALEEAANAFIADPTTATLTPLRSALEAARVTWQDVALFQFGPAEAVALRGTMNTYPTDTDQIEANISAGNYVLGTVANLSAGGFPAVDYLVNGLGDTDDNIVTMYTADAAAAQRLQYLQDNVAFIKTNTDTVVSDWLPTGGNFIGTFLSEDRGGVDVGSSLGQLINAMVLHYERYIRDGKIGIPAGVRSSGVPRPKTTEAFYAGYSLQLVRSSMNAVDRVFQGTGMDNSDGIGLDENLQFLESTDLSNDIKSTLGEIVTSLEQLSDPLSGQIESDVDVVVSAFTKMQELVVLLKADMTSILGITITYQDNDGD